MSHHNFTIKKLADLETLLPGFSKIWPKMKAACGTTQRCPKSVTFTDTPEPVYANDNDSCKRFALDLRDMSLSPSVHVSCGEWAVHAGRNHDGAVQGVPENQAVLTCTYNNYYRTFSMTVLVAKIAGQLAEKAV